MKKRNDFYFNIDTNVFAKRAVSVNLQLTNKSPDDYNVSKEILWLDGFRGELPFSITGPSPVICHISTVHKKNSEITELKSGESLLNNIVLNKYCSMSALSPGSYNIKFYLSHNLYKEHNKEAHYTLHEDLIEEYIELEAQSNFTLTEEVERKIISGDVLNDLMSGDSL